MSYTSKEDITSRMNNRFYSNVNGSNYQPRISSTNQPSRYTQKKREQESIYLAPTMSNYPLNQSKKSSHISSLKSSYINEYEKEFNSIPIQNNWEIEEKKYTFRDKDMNERLTQFQPISQVRAHPIKYDISNVEMKPIDTRQAYFKENT